MIAVGSTVTGHAHDVVTIGVIPADLPPAVIVGELERPEVLRAIAAQARIVRAVVAPDLAEVLADLGIACERLAAALTAQEAS